MNRKILSIVLTAMLVIACIPFAGATVSASPSGIIINQVYGDGGKGNGPSDYCFIELYNSGSETADLTDWSVGYTSSRDSGGGSTAGEEVTVDLTGTIAANSSYLIRCAACTTTPELQVLTIGAGDLEWNQVIDNKQYNVTVYDAEGVAADAVTAIDAEGTVEVAGEGTVVTGVSKQKAIRRVNFADTDINSADFETIKYEKAILADYYDLADFAAAYGPKALADGAWTETVAPEENFVGYDFAGNEGFYGPYGQISEVTANGIELDTSVADAYITAEFKAFDTVNPEIKYAYVTAYSTAPETTDGFSFTIGNISQEWKLWQVSGGTTAPALTADKTTYAIDLEDSGVTSIINTAENAPDFAINKADATEGSVVIESIRFSNTKLAAAAPAPAPTDDIVGYDFVNETGYSGMFSLTPPCYEITEEGLAIDASVGGGYVTADIEEGEVDHLYKYAVVTMKSSAPTTTKNFALGLGGKSNTLFDWYLATTGFKNTNFISDQFTKYVFDLEASGVTTLDAAEGVADFSFNQSSATAGTITIQSIEFVDEIPTLTLDTEPWAGLDFVNNLGFYGPYGSVTATTANGLEFDTSVAAGYITAEVNPQDIGGYKYAYITLKSSAPTTTTNFSLTLGGVGQVWHEWTLADGTTPEAELPTESTTFCIDLEASGVTSVVSTGIDFALNQGEATAGTITVESVRYALTGPGEVPPEPPVALETPANVAAVADSDTEITVTWDAVDGATGYSVLRSLEEDGTYTEVGTATETTFTDTELTAETAYFYKVVATGEADDSEASVAVSATTEAAPAAEAADLYISAITPATATNYDSDPIGFSAVIRNVGGTAVEHYYVSFYINATLLETVEVNTTLEAGAMAPVSTTENWVSYFGSHSVKAIVTEDIDGVNITDTDLTNNALKARFKVIDDDNPNPPVASTTEAPASTTEAPVATTEAPVATTEEPVVTTEAPVVTTEAPVVTTEEPVVTTEAPVVTTEVPVA